MFRKMTGGETSQSIPVLLSNNTTGAGYGGLVFNTSGLAAGYRRQGQSTWTTTSPLITAVLGTWTSWGFVADNPNNPASYELGIPNAALAAGVEWVEIGIWGATGLNPYQTFIELDKLPYQVAPGAAGGLLTVGANAATSFTAGLTISQTTLNGNGLTITGNGTGSGILSTGGASGHGIAGIGGAGGGSGFAGNGGAANGAGMLLQGGGSTGIGFYVMGGTQNAAVAFVGGSTSGQAMWLITTSGYGIQCAGGILANITGTLSGPVISSGPFKINQPAGFSFRMIQNASPYTTPYTGAANTVTGTRSITGLSAGTAVSGTITQSANMVGTNEYYFSGLAADFNGTEIHFAFTAPGALPVYFTVNTNP
jgi:hypothetical protein